MEVENLGVIMIIIISLSAFVMVVFLRKYQNIERMAMIEKGVSPELFSDKRRRGTFGTLRTALLFIGAGVGLLLAYFLDMAFRMEEVAYFSMLFVCGGLGLGAAYLIEEKKMKEEERKI